MSEIGASSTLTAVNAVTELSAIINRRKRLGKCARRRNQKSRAILNASCTSISSCEDAEKEILSSSVKVPLPSDRCITLEGTKIRRREWRAKLELKRRCHNRSCGHDATADEEDDVVPLHPSDEHVLLSQLGYIPGNAICVAARISSMKEDTTTTTTTTTTTKTTSSSSYNHDSSQTQSSSLPTPLVVKLYPMAARQKYGGGKSDGRAFKGRRRGAMRLDAEKNVEVNKVIEPEKQEERDKNAEKEKRESTQHISPPPAGKSKKTKNEIQNDNNLIIEPFPTLYWLTHPQLHTQISKLELSTDYNVSKMEERLRSSPLYLQQMKRAHLSYGRKRWELLTLKDRDYVMQCGWTSALDDSRGVAGIRLCKGDDDTCNNSIISENNNYRDDNGKTEKQTTTTTTKQNGQRRSKGYDCVKCLHAHVAHYLAQVSEWEEGLIKEEEVEEFRIQEEAAMEGNDDLVEGGRGYAVAAAKSRLSHHPIAATTSRPQTTTTTTTKKECDWDDLNLVGKWVMEVVNQCWESENDRNDN